MFVDTKDEIIKVASDSLNIRIVLRKTADLSLINLDFTLSKGARIVSANGKKADFTNNQAVRYKVTSEDGEISTMYSVLITKEDKDISSEEEDKNSILFSFDNVRVNKNKEYNIWSSELGGDWATANSALLESKREKFSAYSITKGAYKGKSVKLVTVDTGLGYLIGKPIAAGSIYLGQFDDSVVMSAPLSSTNFGVNFDKKPIKFSVYYKYIPGSRYINYESKELNDRTDEPAIYAIFYKAKDGDKTIQIDGSNVQNSEYIIARAEMERIPASRSWKKLELTFNYKEDVEAQLLAKQGYKLSIIFSSSKRGAEFLGAEGSTLMIDNLRLHYEEVNN